VRKGCSSSVSLAQHRHTCPIEVQLRWLYPSPPQRVYLSKYKKTLQSVDFDDWVRNRLPNFQNTVGDCVCTHDFPNNGHVFEGHLASDNPAAYVHYPILLDRILRGPDLRETRNDSFEKALEALEAAFDELFQRSEVQDASFTNWQKLLIADFKRQARSLKRSMDSRTLNSLLLPAGRALDLSKPQIAEFLSKYSILVSDKSRGNFFIVCTNLYIKQCVQVLHNSAEYTREQRQAQDVISTLITDLYAILAPREAEKLLSALPYFYLLP
jgi:hypothetical protein